MSAPAFPPGWYPALRLTRLRRAPAQVRLAGTPLFARRSPCGTPQLKDAVTGADWPCAPWAGYLYAAVGKTAGPFTPPPPLLPHPHTAVHVYGEVCAHLADIAENILDTTHTSVVHQGYLRDAANRKSVEAQIEFRHGRITATYPPGAAPGGWGARLLGAHRYTIRDSFCTPAIAEVSYTEDTRPVFSARFSLTPRSDTETFIAGTVAVPGSGPLAVLKLAALRLFFLRIFAEDRAILELISANRAQHGGAPLVYAPQDLLRPGIDAILDGRAAPTARACVSLKV